MIPKYLCYSSSISAWTAYAYLKGISEGDVAKVREVVLGDGAKKLTPSVLSSLKRDWTKQFHEWSTRDLSKVTFTYIYADGIYQKIRGDNPKIYVLVLMGVYEQGKKHMIALEDGVRESTQIWREMLLGAKAHGMNAAKFATGDRAVSFWSALSEVYPSTTHQRCWMHKSGNAMNYLPESTRAKANVDLHQIWMTEGRAKAEEAMTLFEEKYGRNIQGPLSVSPKTVVRCSLSTIFRPSTGCTSAPPTPSNPPLQRYATAPNV